LGLADFVVGRDGFFFLIAIWRTESEGKAAGSGNWDSIHVVEVQTSGARAQYKLTSTVMVSLSTYAAHFGKGFLSVSMKC
jgi:capping protein beta